jgi:hypothetical protein
MRLARIEATEVAPAAAKSATTAEPASPKSSTAAAESTTAQAAAKQSAALSSIDPALRANRLNRIPYAVHIHPGQGAYLPCRAADRH